MNTTLPPPSPLITPPTGPSGTPPAGPSGTPPAGPPGAPTAPGSPAAAGPPRRVRTAGHVVALVIGCLLVLPGLGMAAGGAAAAAAQTWATDDDGFFHTTLDRIETDGVAVATTDLRLDGDMQDVNDGPTWLLDVLDVDLRVTANGADRTDDVFVGIAPTADVERYLSGSPWADVVEIDHRTPRAVEVAGSEPIGAPVEEDFWAVSATGAGSQEVTWAARSGRWSVVVMNADGSPGVGADVEIGVRSGAVTPIAVSLLIVGGVVVAGAVVLIVVGARGRRTRTGPAA